jgi:hypothetical protein
MKNKIRVLAFMAVLSLAAIFEVGLLTCEAAEANMKKVARQRYGDNLRSCELVTDPFWAARLPGYKVYEVNVFNPASRLAGREIFWYLLLKAPDKSFVIIEKNQEAIDFLQTQAVPRHLPFTQLVELFARLLRVKILEEWKPETNPREKEIVAPVYDQVGDEQHAAFYVLQDPVILSVVKYDVYLSPANALRIESRWVSSRGGYD